MPLEKPRRENHSRGNSFIELAGNIFEFTTIIISTLNMVVLISEIFPTPP